MNLTILNTDATPLSLLFLAGVPVLRFLFAGCFSSGCMLNDFAGCFPPRRRGVSFANSWVGACSDVFLDPFALNTLAGGVSGSSSLLKVTGGKSPKLSDELSPCSSGSTACGVCCSSIIMRVPAGRAPLKVEGRSACFCRAD
jgi:hypothetical protein